MAEATDYRMSFSTGGLFLRESVELATLYQELGDWELVKKRSVSSNLLQTRTKASSTRTIIEIVFRLRKLTSVELELLIEGALQDQKYLLWISICRTYPFIGEFAIEILREYYITMRGELQYEDFDYFYNKNADLIHQLDEISPTTRNKLRQVLFRMMREADLLTSGNSITPAIFTPHLIEVVGKHAGKDLQCFPVFEDAIRSMKR
jgi:hypothetical protein